MHGCINVSSTNINRIFPLFMVNILNWPIILSPYTIVKLKIVIVELRATKDQIQILYRVKSTKNIIHIYFSLSSIKIISMVYLGDLGIFRMLTTQTTILYVSFSSLIFIMELILRFMTGYKLLKLKLIKIISWINSFILHW